MRSDGATCGRVCYEPCTLIKMRKEKKKEETERERIKQLNREHNDIDWIGLYNSDNLSTLRGGGGILVLFPSQDHLQREESGKGRNGESVNNLGSPR